MKRLPLVEVTWDDPTVNAAGWGTRALYLRRAAPARVTSVGYLLARTPRRLVLVLSRGTDDDDVDVSLTLPAGCVRRVRRLR